MEDLNSINSNEKHEANKQNEANSNDENVDELPQQSSKEDSEDKDRLEEIKTQCCEVEANTGEGKQHLPSASTSTSTKRPNSDDEELPCKKQHIEAPDSFSVDHPQISSFSVDDWSSNFDTEDKVLVEEDKSSFPTFRFMNSKAVIGICAAGYPAVSLSVKELRNISKILNQNILSQEGCQVKPRFFGYKIMGGCLSLTCGDSSTLSWVKRQVPAMEIKLRKNLQVVDYPPTEKSFIAVGYFLNSQDDSNGTVLKYLGAQNAGLDVSKWKVLDRNPEKKKRAIRLTFSIDWKSAELIKHKGPKLNYKLGAAKFMLKRKGGLRFKEEEEDDDEDEFVPFNTQFSNPHADDDVNPTFSDEFLLSEPSLRYQMPPPFPMNEGDYSARVAMMVEKSKTALKGGMTSRQRYRARKKFGRKKNIKKENNGSAKNHAAPRFSVQKNK